MLRVALASLAGLLLTPAAANAQLPAAHPPAKSVAGVKLTWPTATSLAPGSKVSVKVRSAKRRAVISLVRADGRGIPTRTVARRTLRSGTFSVALPADQGANYQLRAVIAGKRYFSWITTPEPPCNLCGGVSPPLCAPAPAPAAAEMRLQATTLSPGESLAYSVVNTGQRCLTTGAPYHWQLQQPDGSWKTIPLPWAFPMFGIKLRSGGAYAKSAQLPADAAPGTYRLVDDVLTDGEIYPAGVIELISGPIVVS